MKFLSTLDKICTSRDSKGGLVMKNVYMIEYLHFRLSFEIGNDYYENSNC